MVALIFLWTLLLALPGVAQHRSIPTSVINAAFGITTPRPAYFLEAMAADSSSVYVWAIGDYTNTRNNYDSLGFYSALWQLHFASDQWIALDRLSGFPGAARWIQSSLDVSSTAPLLFPSKSPTTPHSWWGWLNHDTSKVSEQSLPSHLLRYTPQAPTYGQPIWSFVGLPPLPEWRRESYHALGGVLLPHRNDTTFVALSTSMRLWVPYYQAWNYPPRLDIYSGRPDDDSLLLRSSVLLDKNYLDTVGAIPVPSNLVLAPDNAIYTLLVVPYPVSRFDPKPIPFLRIDPTTGEQEIIRPISGLTHVNGLDHTYIWSHDSSLYVVCPFPTRIAPGTDTSSFVSIFRFNVFTRHAERLYGQMGFNIGQAAYTPYRNGIAALGVGMIGDSSYPMIYFLQHAADGTLQLTRVPLKEYFPTSGSGLRQDVPGAIAFNGRYLIVTTSGGLYIIDSTTSSVRPSQPTDRQTFAYPQPARRGQIVRCSLPSTVNSATITARLFDAMGKEYQLPFTIESDAIAFPTDRLTAGTYWLVVHSGSTNTRWFQSIVIE